MEVDIQTSGLDALRIRFNNLNLKLKDWSQELFDIGILLLRSQDLNFRDQGRPIRWTPSEAAQKRQGMTLVDTGRLRRSVSIYGDPDNKFKLTPNVLQISTDVSYGKYLQETWPFLVIQDEDVTRMEQIINNSIQRMIR